MAASPTLRALGGIEGDGGGSDQGHGAPLPGGIRPASPSEAMHARRIALLAGLAPAKRGSMEEWVVALAREAGARGHEIDCYGLEPVDPTFRARLEATGTTWRSASELLRSLRRARRCFGRYDVVHLNFFGTASRGAFAAYLAHPTALIYVDHFSKREAAPTWARRLKRWPVRRLARARISMAVGVSEFARRHARRALGLPDHRTTTIYNGVDLRRFAARPPRPRSHGPPVILAVANLIPEKGVHHLVNAVASLPETRLRIAGDGPEAPRLRELAVERGIADRTEFLGTRNDVEELLAGCDIFVHPATWSEAFGLAIVEAMASGRPVIASRAGAIPELIEDGTSGMLVPPGDERALRSSLQTLLGDRDLARKLADAGRARVEARFGLERCVAEHLDLCERVCG